MSVDNIFNKCERSSESDHRHCEGDRNKSKSHEIERVTGGKVMTWL